MAVVLLVCGTVSAATTDGKGFVRDWLLAGPYPNYVIDGKHQGYTSDPLGGEAWVKPRAGDTAQVTFKADLAALVSQVGGVNEWGFRTDRTFDVTWTELHAETGVISLNGRFRPIDDHFIAYAATYVTAPADKTVLVFCGSDDDCRVWVNSTEIGGSETSQATMPGCFRYVAHLKKGVNRILMKVCDRDADCGFCLQIVDLVTYSPTQGLTVSTEPGPEPIVLDRERERECRPANVAARRAELLGRRAAAQAERDALLREEKSLEPAVTGARARLAAAFAAAERAYAAEHAAAAAKGARSADRPLPAATTRSELCLNGEWEASRDGKTWTDRFRLPSCMPAEFFSSWFWPVRPSDPKNRFSKPVFANEAFAKDGPFSPYYTAPRSRFRTTFDWDGAGCVVFRAEAILGTAEVLVNGVSCGAYDGLVGIWRVPLSAAKKGRNVLELRYGRLSVGPERQMSGVRGDLYVEFVPTVRVDELYVRPSWRKASLVAETTLTNAGARAVSVEVRAAAVKDGRVRLELPTRRLTLAAGAAGTVTAERGWADPILWGPGGEFGSPELYELVTDVFVDGRLVDRQREPFGFREFWIHATDFFLNGRRYFIQGDVNHSALGNRKVRDVFWPLLRADGINAQRFHDNDYWSVPAVRDADRMGMLTYAQCYPSFPEPMGEEIAEATHAYNRANYLRWWKSLRNHPSVVIWSLDNEIFTQGKHRSPEKPRHARDDRAMGGYEKWMRGVDPTLVLTRDGDGGTWFPSEPTWTDPPAMTANYHYPDYSSDTHVLNWRTTYGFRPAIFGETLYCSYGAFDQNVGALPDQVTRKAKKVRAVVALYREEEVPAPMFMGLGLDGFVQLDDTGKGNPWGLKETDRTAYEKEGVLPKGFAADGYPWARLVWPALSGEGERPLAQKLHQRIYGCLSVNWADARFPSHVRNRVNDAYRDSLRPQPPLVVGTDAEVIVSAAPNADVWSVDADGVRRGVRADARGLAWFHFDRAGRVTFAADGRPPRAVDIPARGEKATAPGFADLPRLSL